MCYTRRGWWWSTNRGRTTGPILSSTHKIYMLLQADRSVISLWPSPRPRQAGEICTLSQRNQLDGPGHSCVGCPVTGCISRSPALPRAAGFHAIAQWHWTHAHACSCGPKGRVGGLWAWVRERKAADSLQSATYNPVQCPPANQAPCAPANSASRQAEGAFALPQQETHIMGPGTAVTIPSDLPVRSE